MVFDGDAPRFEFRAPEAVRVWRKDRVLTVLSKAGPEPILAEAHALNPVAIDVASVSLKEIFLETVNAED
jgi:hypothetical protein